MTPSENKPELGPRRISLATFLFKLLAAGLGGTAGSLILLVVFVLASSILTPITQGETNGYVSPIFLFFIMIMIFLSSTIGNLLSAFLISLTDRDKYVKISSALYQIFILSVVIFLLSVPVYFLTAAVDVSAVSYAVALQIIISAQVSALILEIISDYKYALVGLYGTTFSILVSAAVLFGMYAILGNGTLILFVALPVVWLSIAFVQSVVTIFYGWVARTYDRDFLATDSNFGDDYGKPYTPKPQVPRAKDESGANFLRHN